MDDTLANDNTIYVRRFLSFLWGCWNLEDEKLENWFITRKEYTTDQKEINRRLYEQDLKFNQLQNDNRRILDDLSELPETFKSLNSTLKSIDDRVVEVENKSIKNTERLDVIEGNIQSRSEQNTKIIVSVIGAFGVILAAALGLAQVFF